MFYKHSQYSIFDIQFSNESGFTFIEVLVTVLILALIMSAVVFQGPKFLVSGRDAQRKVDLKVMKTALEDYANDQGCYPANNQMNNCTSTILEPNIKRIPCDPQTKQPYSYSRSSDCISFELYTTLEKTSDPDIEELGCDDGCGPGGDYNYGVVGGKALLD